MSWFFKTIFTKHVLVNVTPDQTAKLLLNFYMEATSLSLGPQPGSLVTEVLALPVASLRNCARSLAFNDCGLCPTTPRQMGTVHIYLMFGQWTRLPVNFVFPTVGSNEAPMREASARSVDVYIASVRDRLRSTLQEVQAQSTTEACQQKQYNKKIGTVNLKPGNLVLVKADAWKGKRKIKDRWEEETWEVVCQIAADIPSYEVTNQHGWS